MIAQIKRGERNRARTHEEPIEAPRAAKQQLFPKPLAAIKASGVLRYSLINLVDIMEETPDLTQKEQLEVDEYVQQLEMAEKLGLIEEGEDTTISELAVKAVQECVDQRRVTLGVLEQHTDPAQPGPIKEETVALKRHYEVIRKAAAFKKEDEQVADLKQIPEPQKSTDVLIPTAADSVFIPIDSDEELPEGEETFTLDQLHDDAIILNPSELTRQLEEEVIELSDEEEEGYDPATLVPTISSIQNALRERADLNKQMSSIHQTLAATDDRLAQSLGDFAMVASRSKKPGLQGMVEKMMNILQGGAGAGPYRPIKKEEAEGSDLTADGLLKASVKKTPVEPIPPPAASPEPSTSQQPMVIEPVPPEEQLRATKRALDAAVKEIEEKRARDETYTQSDIARKYDLKLSSLNTRLKRAERASPMKQREEQTPPP